MVGKFNCEIMQEATLLLSIAGALMTSLADVGEALAERRGVETPSKDAAGSGTVRCPRACFCNSPSHIVYCSRRGLAAIPDGVSPDTLQLNLNGNLFSSTTVTRSNVSEYLILEHLYLSECGLEYIEVAAFSDLIHLRWLDLSNNRIKAIEPRTFDGLTLQHLFINGNRNVRIHAESFVGLATTGLYLHDCSLRSISPEAIVRLNFTLRYLWLNGNELERLDPRLKQLFDVLLHLRLGTNPLRCNCWAVWLKQFFDESRDMFKGALPPTCLRPTSLKGRHFNNLTVHDLRCQAPMFNEVEATFDVDASAGRLTCVASGEPAPVLYWIQPSGKATRYSAPPTSDSQEEDQLGLNEAVLELEKDGHNDPTESGMYICVADNDAGNATLTVSLPSPYPPRIFAGSTFTNTHSTQTDTSKKQTDVHDNALMNRVQSFDDVVDDYSVAEVNVRVRSSPEHGSNSERRFTVTQLSCAVVGTHLSTLALCLLVAAILCQRSRSAEDLARSDDDDFDARHVRHLHSTGSSLMTGSDVKKMADMTAETVYLRLNGMHPYRCTGSYLSDTSTTAVSVTR